MSSFIAIFPKTCEGTFFVNSLSKALDSYTFVRAHLHAYHGVDKEQHDDKEGDVGQSLKGFNERPQQRADAFSSAQ